MSHKFESGKNKILVHTMLTRALGANAMEILMREFGAAGRDTLITEIATALEQNPVSVQAATITDERQMSELLTQAAQKQSEITHQYFNKSGLTELGEQLYNGTYGFILQNPDLKKIHENWKTSSPDDQKKLCTAIVKNLSQQFNVPEPKLLFQTGKTLPLNGLSLPNAIVLSLSNGGGIIGLITHEFTHHLQRNGKTPGATACNQYYIPAVALGANVPQKYKDFAYKAMSDSLEELEAQFTSQYVKDMYRKHHMDAMTQIPVEKSRN